MKKSRARRSKTSNGRPIRNSRRRYAHDRACRHHRAARRPGRRWVCIARVDATMTARATKSPTMILAIKDNRYLGCVINRGVAGHEAFSAVDESLGMFATPTDARDAILRELAT